MVENKEAPSGQPYLEVKGRRSGSVYQIVPTVNSSLWEIRSDRKMPAVLATRFTSEQAALKYLTNFLEKKKQTPRTRAKNYYEDHH